MFLLRAKSLLLSAEAPWSLSAPPSSAQKDPGEGLPMNDAADIEGFWLDFCLFVFLNFSVCVWYDRESCTKVLNSVGGNGC